MVTNVRRTRRTRRTYRACRACRACKKFKTRRHRKTRPAGRRTRGTYRRRTRQKQRGGNGVLNNDGDTVVVYWIRHGYSKANDVKKRFSGFGRVMQLAMLNPGLTLAGCEDSRKRGHIVLERIQTLEGMNTIELVSSIKTVYASNLLRTQETAWHMFFHRHKSEQVPHSNITAQITPLDHIHETCAGLNNANSGFKRDEPSKRLSCDTCKCNIDMSKKPSIVESQILPPNTDVQYQSFCKTLMSGGVEPSFCHANGSEKSPVIIVVSHSHFIKECVTDKWMETLREPGEKTWKKSDVLEAAVLKDCKPTISVAEEQYTTSKLENNGCVRVVYQKQCNLAAWEKMKQAARSAIEARVLFMVVTGSVRRCAKAVKKEEEGELLLVTLNALNAQNEQLSSTRPRAAAVAATGAVAAAAAAAEAAVAAKAAATQAQTNLQKADRECRSHPFKLVILEYRTVFNLETE